MIKVHKKFIILVAIFVSLTAASFSVWYFFFSKDKSVQQEEVIKPKTLSDEEKARILESLAARNKTEISTEEKKVILESLNKRETQTLSDEEKARILESLNNRN